MGKKLIISATFLFASLALIVGILAIPENNMPGWVDSMLIIISVLAFLFFLASIYFLWAWIKPIINKYGVLILIYKKDKSSPYYWMIQQMKEPRPNIIITDRLWHNFEFNKEQKYINLVISYRNLNVYDLTLDKLSGFICYKSERLPIINRTGKSRVPVGQQGDFRFNVFVPDSIATDMHNDVERHNGDIEILLELSVEVSIYGHKQVFSWGIPSGRGIFRLSQ